jgi:CheY-like chemotaxis protein
MWSWLQAIPNIVSKLQTETDDDQRVKKPAAEINQPRILIVDDNPAIHEDFRKTLAPRGSGVDERCDELEALFFDASAAPKIEELALELDVVYQGEDAILAEERAVQEGRPYELAFVDIRMPPGIDGIETATRLWQLDSRLEVVICSAYSDYSWEEMSRRMTGAGSWVILKKPFDPIEVRQLAHSLTAKWRLQRNHAQCIETLKREVAAHKAELERAARELSDALAARLRLEKELERLRK